jgi:hypothetical protein
MSGLSSPATGNVAPTAEALYPDLLKKCLTRYGFDRAASPSTTR